MSDRIENSTRCAATFEAEIARHDGLLSRWARYYAHGRNFVTVEEIMHEGRLAMWQMWRHYQADFKVKFITFATQHIRRRMLWYVMDATETIRIPRQQNLASWIPKRIGMASLDAPMVQGWGEEAGEKTLAEIMVDETPCPAEAAQRRDDAESLAHHIARLPEREQRIIAARYQAGQTIREVAADLGITHQRVYQIEADAIVMLRRAMTRQRVAMPRDEKRRRAA